MSAETIFREMSNHIGQVKECEAQAEIERLEKKTGKKWRKDYTPYLEDDDWSYSKASKLYDGFCWIVTEE